MPNVEDVQFDTTGWELQESSPNRITWGNAFGDVLTKRFSLGPPKMPGLFRKQELQEYCAQQAAAAGGTLLLVDLLHVKGTSVGKMLFKAPHAKGRLGFVGTLIFAYRDFNYSIRIQALERAGDEVRAQKANLMLEMLPRAGVNSSASGMLQSTGNGELAVQSCASDDEAWDQEFPRHPLSRVRMELARLIPTLQISRDVKNSVPHHS